MLNLQIIKSYILGASLSKSVIVVSSRAAKHTHVHSSTHLAQYWLMEVNYVIYTNDSSKRKSCTCQRYFDVYLQTYHIFLESGHGYWKMLDCDRVNGE